MDQNVTKEFETPKGPLTPENQALYINAINLKKEIEPRLEKVGSNLKETLQNDLLRLDHVKRYATGKPFDPISASLGTTYIENSVNKRVHNLEDPDDAAAANKELTLVQQAEKSLEEYIQKTKSTD
jgi:hypothetical protein